MKTKIRSPSHVCPQCGEWWEVEPLDQNIWRVVRYGDHTRAYNELVWTPKCPDCKTVELQPWLIDDKIPNEPRRGSGSSTSNR